jgi:hypothetical protein
MVCGAPLVVPGFLVLGRENDGQSQYRQLLTVSGEDEIVCPPAIPPFRQSGGGIPGDGRHHGFG